MKGSSAQAEQATVAVYASGMANMRKVSQVKAPWNATSFTEDTNTPAEQAGTYAK